MRNILLMDSASIRKTLMEEVEKDQKSEDKKEKSLEEKEKETGMKIEKEHTDTINSLINSVLEMTGGSLEGDERSILLTQAIEGIQKDHNKEFEAYYTDEEFGLVQMEKNLKDKYSNKVEEAMGFIDSLDSGLEILTEDNADLISSKKKDILNYIETNRPFSSDGSIDVKKVDELTGKVKEYLNIYVKFFSDRLRKTGQDIKMKIQEIVNAFSQLAGVKLVISVA